MPRKTREQKMAAALRRLKARVQPQAKPSSPPPKKQKPQTETPSSQDYSYSVSLPKTPQAAQPVKTEVQRYDYAYVSSDLKKIALLSVFAIVLEIVLSLTMRLEFAKLLLRRFGIDI